MAVGTGVVLVPSRKVVVVTSLLVDIESCCSLGGAEDGMAASRECGVVMPSLTCVTFIVDIDASWGDTKHEIHYRARICILVTL